MKNKYGIWRVSATLLAVLCTFSACLGVPSSSTSSSSSSDDTQCLHDSKVWVDTKDATCTEEGLKVQRCSNCGDIFDEEVIEQLPHSDGGWVVEKEPTMVAEGLKWKKCLICGTVTDTETIAPTLAYRENTQFEQINYANIYVADRPALEAGLVYNFDPTDMTFNLSDGTAKVAKIENIKTPILQEICNAGLDCYDRFMVVENSTVLSGLPMVAGYTYSITIDYYAHTSQNSHLIARNDTYGNFTISNNNWVFEKGRYSVTYNYTVRSGDKDFILYTQNSSIQDVYVGAIKVDVSPNGPTMSQMTQKDGYNWPINQLRIGDACGHARVADIINTDARNALLSAGHSAEALALYTVNGTVYGFDRQPMFAPGYTYTITMEYYAESTGGYIIAMDSTYENHTHVGPDAFLAGYHKSTYTFTVGTKGEYALIFYNAPQMYIVSFNVKLNDKCGEVYKAPSNFYNMSAYQLGKGYTFDFSQNNVPKLEGGTYMNVNEVYAENSGLENLQTVLTEENGFKDYTYYVNRSNITFALLNGKLITNKAYTFTMRVYSPTGIDTDKLLCHGVDSNLKGSGDSLDAKFTCSTVLGLPNVYDITATVKPGNNTHTYITYYTSTEEYYVIQLKVQAQDAYTEPTFTGTHPEYGFTSNNNAPAPVVQTTTLSNLVHSMGTNVFSNALTAPLVGGVAGLSNASNVGIHYEEFDDILYPVPSNASFERIINVQSYNIKPSNTGEINSANFAVLIAELSQMEGMKKVYFPEGTYKFARTLVFDDVSDVYFCSERYDKYFNILITQWAQAISITNCHNIHFNNFTLDYETPSTITGSIAYQSGNSVVINVDSEFDLNRPEYAFGSRALSGSYIEYVYDANAQRQVPNPNGNLLYKESMSRAYYDGSTRQLVIDFATPIKAVGAGTMVSVAFTMYDYFGIYMMDCSNVYMEQANIYHTMGMAFGGSVCENVYLNGFRLSPNPDSAKLMTATADGFHPVQFKGEIVVTNSIFEFSHDDSFNVKNAYQDLRAVQPKKIFYNPSIDILVEPGDTIEVYRYTDFYLMGTYKVSAVDKKQNCYIIDGRVNESYPDTVGYRICNASKSASLKIHNTFIGNKRNRGMLLQTRNVEISNCTFMNIIHGPIQIFSVYNEFMEGMMPRDVVVKDNKFINNYAIDVNVFVWGSSGTAQGVLKNVTTQNNFFYGSFNESIAYSGVGNSSIIGNLVAYSRATYTPATLSQSAGVTVANNVVADSYTRQFYSIGAGVTGVSDSNNLSTTI